MEEEVFEQDDVATFMNRNFVCIKVDREERPDIDATYMHAVQLITGRGGWPLSVFLTPDLNPFFGGTYFPHDAFVQLVHKVHDVYQTQRADLDQQGKMLSERVSSLPVIKPGTAETSIDDEKIATVASQAEINFDAKFGGFKGKQKFPTPVRWQFLLHHYRKSGDRKYANMTALTLEAMAAGGIYDHVGGGFHRYSTDNKWIVPLLSDCSSETTCIHYQFATNCHLLIGVAVKIRHSCHSLLQVEWPNHMSFRLEDHARLHRSLEQPLSK